MIVSSAPYSGTLATLVDLKTDFVILMSLYTVHHFHHYNVNFNGIIHFFLQKHKETIKKSERNYQHWCDLTSRKTFWLFSSCYLEIFNPRYWRGGEWTEVGCVFPRTVESSVPDRADSVCSHGALSEANTWKLVTPISPPYFIDFISLVDHIQFLFNYCFISKNVTSITETIPVNSTPPLW